MAVQKKRSISVRIGFGALPVRDGEEFGLQDKAGVVHAAKRASKTRSVFACELTVGSDTGTPTLGGPFAQGPPSGRFLYLSWRRIGGTGWIERVEDSPVDVGQSNPHRAAYRPDTRNRRHRAPAPCQRSGNVAAYCAGLTYALLYSRMVDSEADLPHSRLAIDQAPTRIAL